MAAAGVELPRAEAGESAAKTLGGLAGLEGGLTGGAGGMDPRLLQLCCPQLEQLRHTLQARPSHCYTFLALTLHHLSGSDATLGHVHPKSNSAKSNACCLT